MPIKNVESFDPFGVNLDSPWTERSAVRAHPGAAIFFQLLAFFVAFYLFGGHFEHSHDLRAGYGRLNGLKKEQFRPLSGPYLRRNPAGSFSGHLGMFLSPKMEILALLSLMEPFSGRKTDISGTFSVICKLR